MRATEPAHVEGPQVHAGIAVEDPIRHRLARAARGGNAGGEAAGHEEIVELWREPQDRFAVGRDRYRSVDDGLDANFVEDRQSLRARQREQLEALHILGEQLPPELEGGTRAPAALRPLLPSPDRESTDIGLEIEILVGIAQRRQRLGQIELLLGEKILVLDNAGGERCAGHVADPFRPQSGAVDENVATDSAVVGGDALDPAAFFNDAGDGRAFLQRCAVLARGGREGLREPIGVDVTVRGNERSADDAVRIDIREEIDRLLRRERMALETKALRQCHRPANFAPPLGRGREPQRSDFLPVDRLPRLRFEPVEHGDRVLHQPREVLAAAQLPDEARRMPGAAVGELRFFEQEDIAFTPPCQRIGDRAADGASADDDDARMAIEGH